MNEDNEYERQDRKHDDNLIKTLREDTKRNAKSKFSMVFRKAMTIVVPVLLKLLIPILLASLIIAGAWSIIKPHRDNNASAEAVSKALQDKDVVDIVISNDGDGYYFQISNDVVDKYIEELNKAYRGGYYKMAIDLDKLGEDSNPKAEDKFDESDMEKWFGTKDYRPYFIKMLRAEIASTYPRLSNDNVAVARYDEQNNPVDKNGNYIVQGVVQIMRTKMSYKGDNAEAEEPIFLDYLPHEQLRNKIASGDMSALDYFSFNPETGLIYYATFEETYKAIVVGTDTPNINWDVSSFNELIGRNLVERSEPYKELTSMCSMPYNFTFSLLQKTENPEWVMAVTDLLLEEENTNIVLMIQDQLSISKYLEAMSRVHEIEIFRYSTYLSMGISYWFS